MATTPSKPSPKSPAGAGGGRRVLIIVGAGLVLVLGYLIFKSRGGSSSSSSPSGDPSSGAPSSSSGDSGSGADAAGILAALAGENQQLLGAFLQSENGLVTLAGGSTGSTSSTTGSSSAPSPSSSPSSSSPSADSSSSSSASADLFQAPALTAPADSGLGIIQAQEGYGSPASATPAQVQQAQAAGQSYLESFAANNTLGFLTGIPDNVSGSGSVEPSAGGIDLPDSVSGSGPYTPPPSPPVYGITYGAPAGERASSTKTQGTISVH